MFVSCNQREKLHISLLIKNDTQCLFFLLIQTGIISLILWQVLLSVTLLHWPETVLCPLVVTNESWMKQKFAYQFIKEQWQYDGIDSTRLEIVCPICQWVKVRINNSTVEHTYKANYISNKLLLTNFYCRKNKSLRTSSSPVNCEIKLLRIIDG